MPRSYDAKIDAFVDTHRAEFLKDLESLVQIPSVRQPGSETAPFGEPCAQALEAALRLAERKGMRIQNCGNWYGLASSGTGKRRVGIFAHLDVVEPGEGWTYPPFSMTQQDGWLIGRGVGDDKLAAVLGVYSSQALEELRLAEHTELTLYLGCGEETGMEDLERYLCEQTEPDFSLVPDFLFPVSVGEPGRIKVRLRRLTPLETLEAFEGGTSKSRVPLSAFARYTGNAADAVRNAAIRRQDMTLEETEDRLQVQAAGRMASPWRLDGSTNAIAELARFLAESGALSPADVRCMNALSSMAGETDGAYFEIDGGDALFGPLQCCCQQAGMEEDRLCITLDIRHAPAVSAEDIREAVASRAAMDGFAVTDFSTTAPWQYAQEDGKAALLCECCADVTGQPAVPRTGGSTYAKLLRRAVNFGPKFRQKCPFLPTGHGELHGPDEAISAEAALDALKIYIRAIARLEEWYEANE